MTNIFDTIAAIATGLTEAGIGIIRISGPEAYTVISKIFINSRGLSVDFSFPNRVHYGYIIDYVSRETIDEVLVINLLKPHSYTGEDTIEIDCHGGILVMRRILENVIHAGARVAEPGEFTKRAFLNGRIDLSQAEAVIDIINSRNIKAVDASVKQLRGSLSLRIKNIREEILKDCAYIESCLDDPEHYEFDSYRYSFIDHVNSWRLKLDELNKSYKRGRLVREGINTVILGKPNTGKSSLLNAMLGEERAIVTDIPGTTRDFISENIYVDGINLNITDTAGIRNSNDSVESLGVAKALDKASQADLVLCLFDWSKKLDSDDIEIIHKLSEGNFNYIIILNKSDLDKELEITDILGILNNNNAVYLSISAKYKIGIDLLFRTISDMFSCEKIDYNDELFITSIRHQSLINNALDSVCEVIKSLDTQLPEDFFTIDLMNAYKYLGEIIGEEVNDDLINEIFSRFCMGK